MNNVLLLILVTLGILIYALSDGKSAEIGRTLVLCSLFWLIYSIAHGAHISL